MKSDIMYDIFVRFPDGAPLWLEAVEGLESARKRLASLVSASDAEYFIYSEKSGGIIERNSSGGRVSQEKAGPAAGSQREDVHVGHP